jgi:hypothetical protein
VAAAPRDVSPHDLSSIFSLLWPLLLAFTLPQLVFFRFYAWGMCGCPKGVCPGGVSGTQR